MGKIFTLKDYNPHAGQIAFHYAAEKMFRFLAMICGIRGGKTYSGAREAGKQAWNFKGHPNGVYGIIAPTFHMLDRTTWREFKLAVAPLIAGEDKSKKIITLKNGREVYGFSAENPDKIRNVTLIGFWVDEAREAKNFGQLWDVLLGRVLSTNGKGIVTTSPNSFDDIYEIFIENPKKGYGTIKFPTYENRYISKEAIDELAANYDEKFAQQELYGEIVVFEGQVYYTFNRKYNAGDRAFKVCEYDASKPIALCCDFNVDPMAWTMFQVGKTDDNLEEVRFIDEIFLRNSNTIECCEEFKRRYPNHDSGLVLYGDATGENRSANSNITNWKIIKTELQGYRPITKVRSKNPAERDRVNAVNGLICNSKGQRRVQVHPQKCKHLIRDFEQVPWKEGKVQIDKNKDLMLTHCSDAAGYAIERDYSLNKAEIKGLKI